ncbi:hypothetical protein QBC44DRAFT_22566 [Cladorrhinum sp. PSN332]|nr:hypothetical protein QBC44DRAFT_22566 [Cladorrhinum sp. PSN332]
MPSQLSPLSLALPLFFAFLFFPPLHKLKLILKPGDPSSKPSKTPNHRPLTTAVCGPRFKKRVYPTNFLLVRCRERDGLLEPGIPANSIGHETDWDIWQMSLFMETNAVHDFRLFPIDWPVRLTRLVSPRHHAARSCASWQLPSNLKQADLN